MRNSNAAESFLYIWYDTKNKMFYLGKHKGTPDDSYTHSSTQMESFNKDNIPSHMRRRILAYGTDEEMCLLEHECLKNRKEKKWDWYYNVHVGDPRYVDQSGKNHPNYKDGLSRTPEGQRNYYKKKRDQIRGHQKKYYENNKERLKIKNKEHGRVYYKDNKELVLQKQREYYLKNKKKISEYKREKYLKKKAERLVGGATLPM